MRKYGWKPDLPDHRDMMYSVTRIVTLPPKVDLRPGCPEVYDQGSLGSCTANAIGSAFQFGQIKQNVKEAFIPSRLFIYFNEREMEGTVNEDSGAYIRDGIKSLVKQGVCPESEWQYNISIFTRKPSKTCYDHALKHQLLLYKRISPSLNQMKGCLAEGFPFVFGFSVYESFNSQQVASSGVMSMPKKNENLLGGHAVKAVGYDDKIQMFIVKNSYSDSWGDKGYFYMPYSYISNSNLADDFWTIRLVEEGC